MFKLLNNFDMVIWSFSISTQYDPEALSIFKHILAVSLVLQPYIYISRWRPDQFQNAIAINFGNHKCKIAYINECMLCSCHVWTTRCTWYLPFLIFSNTFMLYTDIVIFNSSLENGCKESKWDQALITKPLAMKHPFK